MLLPDRALIRSPESMDIADNQGFSCKRKENDADDLALKFERASRAYVEENGITRDADWFLPELQEEMGELTQAWNRAAGEGGSRGAPAKRMVRDLEDEAADVLGHILLSSRTGITSTRPPRSSASGCFHWKIMVRTVDTAPARSCTSAAFFL